MITKPIKMTWVIDDDPLQVLVLSRLLTANQAVKSTKFFSGSKSAIESLIANKGIEQNLPDLIFLDLIMTHGDGWDFLEYYKKNRSKFSRRPRIVVISSPSEDSSRRLKQYPEVFGFLSKPISISGFEEMINLVLEREEAA